MLVLAIDQITKWQVRRVYEPNATRLILPGYFDFTYVQNSGGAFGIFLHHPQVLALACFAAVIAIAAFVIRSRAKIPKLLGFALALPLGGAVGNLVDRVRFGWVTDFLHVHAGRFDWPVFNVADSAICIGVGLLVIYSWLAPAHTPALPLAGPEKQ